tara:strand:- start:254 stop:616 length:363 start_codon:yes stop_codon:yes gene_type:complete
MTWKWHITMATSILHRATGVALYIGAILIVGWLVALTLGQDAYNTYAGLIGSVLGQIAMFGFTVAVMYHIANGIRHLFWDAGKGYNPGTANATAWIVILFAIVSSVAIWMLLILNLGQGA